MASIKPSIEVFNRSRSTGRSLPLFGLYGNVFAASIRSTALRLTAFFGSALLCEEALSQIKIIQTRYRRRLADEHSQYRLHMCQSDYEHSF
jgi:hypothetical protein